jgi:TolA-binding protein
MREPRHEGRASVDDDRLNARTAALVDLARDALGEMSERQRIDGLQALRDRIGRRQIATRWRWGAVAAGGVAAGVAAAVAIAPGRHDLSVRVEGGTLGPDGGVTAASGAPVLRFSDGSEIALRVGAHARVRSMDAHGARVTLDEGEAHVYVVHAQETHWAFEAGPFVVAVTGTAFGLSWHGGSGRLDVRLENGAVTVTGPPSDAPLSLRAGQWLTVRGSDVRIRALNADESADLEAPDAGAAASALPPAESPDRNTTPGVPAAPEAGRTRGDSTPAAPSDTVVRRGESRVEHAEDRWRSELAAGQFQAIVDQALGQGLDAAFARSPSGELAALADAARYVRRGEIARGALQAQRQRFPGSERARAAAFFLGRMAEADGDVHGALGWFDAYLGEAPNGTYAPEALGRKMTLVEKVEGKAAARGLAQAYMRRFPGGAYADAAHALLADAP